MIDRKSSLFLMANLGAEVSRAFSFKEKNEKKSLGESIDRCKNMINEVMNLPEMKTRTQELSILREVMLDLNSEESSFSINKKSLQNYFSPFATRLMALMST